MENEVVLPLDKLNNSYYNKLLTCQGIVTEISPEFEDNTHGYIQIISLQGLNKDKQQIGLQQNKKIIVPEEFVDRLSLRDKVRIKGTMVVHNAQDSKSRYRAVLANNLKIINDEEFVNLTKQEIKSMKRISKQPLVQQKIANFIYNNKFFNNDIKLIGALILFCADSKIFVEQRIHCNLGLLIVGKSGTYKTSYLKAL